MLQFCYGIYLFIYFLFGIRWFAYRIQELTSDWLVIRMRSREIVHMVGFAYKVSLT